MLSKSYWNCEVISIIIPILALDLHFILHTELADMYLLSFCASWQDRYASILHQTVSQSDFYGYFFCHLCIFMQYKVFQLTNLQKLLPKNNYALNVNSL